MQNSKTISTPQEIAIINRSLTLLQNSCDVADSHPQANKVGRKKDRVSCLQMLLHIVRFYENMPTEQQEKCRADLKAKYDEYLEKSGI